MIFITEILLKVALNAIALTNPKNSVKNQLTIYATNHVPNPRLCLDAIGSVHTFGIPL